MGYFRANQLKGTIAKAIVQGLLEESNYRVYPYGYESQLSQIRHDVKRQAAAETESVMRLRSSPDLLVYDSDRGNLFFTETKFRRVNNPHQVSVRAIHLARYKKYWNDSVLVLVIPTERCFYAQRVGDLSAPENPQRYDTIAFDMTRDFLPIEQIFTKVTRTQLDECCQQLQRISIMEPEVMEPDFVAAEDIDYLYEYWETYGRYP